VLKGEKSCGGGDMAARLLRVVRDVASAATRSARGHRVTDLSGFIAGPGSRGITPAAQVCPFPIPIPFAQLPCALTLAPCTGCPRCRPAAGGDWLGGDDPLAVHVAYLGAAILASLGRSISSSSFRAFPSHGIKLEHLEIPSGCMH
jgi:hypothetical protein